VVDDHPGDRRQRRHQGLVLVGELLLSVFLGEVQVPEDLAADLQRHAEEGPHGRVTGRKADRVGVARQIREPQRPRVYDQKAEDPRTFGEAADGGHSVVVHAHGDELGQVLALVVEHPDRPVARTGDRACHLGHAPQHAVQIEVRAHHHRRVEQGM
jgi:hypothetical protein